MIEQLRFVSAEALSYYLGGLNLAKLHSGGWFSDRLISGSLDIPQTLCPSIPRTEVVYHSWCFGFAPITALERAHLESATDANALRISAFCNEPRERLSQWAAAGDILDIEKLAQRAITDFGAMQNRKELIEFLRTVQPERPRTVIEIGAGRGGLLYCLCQVSAADALLISVDLPNRTENQPYRSAESRVFESFAMHGQTVTRILGNSGHRCTRDRVHELLDGREVDLLFIDGDHSYEGVKCDFDLYSPLVMSGGLVGFHDICVGADNWYGSQTLTGEQADVKRFWNELKNCNALEIVDFGGCTSPMHRRGADVAWGIGLIPM